VGSVDLEAAALAADVVDDVGDGQTADAETTDESAEPEVARTAGDAVAGSFQGLPPDGAPEAVQEPGQPQASTGGADAGSSPSIAKAVTSVRSQTTQNTAASETQPTGSVKPGPGTATGAADKAASDGSVGVAKPEAQGTDGRLVDERAKATGSPVAPSTVAQTATARDDAGSAASGNGRHGEGSDRPGGRFVVDQATVASDAEAEFSATQEPATSVLRAGAGAATHVPAGRPGGPFGVVSAHPSGSALIAGAGAAHGGGGGEDAPSRTFDEGALMGSGSRSAFQQGEVPQSPAGASSTVAADVARTAGAMARAEQAMEAGLARALVGRLRDDGQMRLAVRPEGLGELDIRVAVRESGVHATIGAQHDEARQLLNSQRADLEAALERHNLRLDSFSVDVGGQESRSGMRHEDAHGSFAHQGGLSADVPQAESTLSVRAHPHRVGGLSVRA
jgi:hypothetical protein